MNGPLRTIQEDVEIINTPNTCVVFSGEFNRRHGRDHVSIGW